MCTCYWKWNPPSALFSCLHWAETMASGVYLTWVHTPPPSRLSWISGDWWAYNNRINQNGCSSDAWTALSCCCGSRVCLYLSLVSFHVFGQSPAWAIPINLILEQSLGWRMYKIKKRMETLKLKLAPWALRSLVFLLKASLYFPVRSLTG